MIMKLADISTFEDLQARQHTIWGMPEISVFNAYSEEERLNKAKQFRQELAKLKTEVDTLLFETMSTQADIADIKSMEISLDRAQQAHDRMQFLKRRISELQENDSEGAFVDPCLDLLTDIDKLEMFIKGKLNNPYNPSNPPNRGLINRGLINRSVFAVFD